MEQLTVTLANLSEKIISVLGENSTHHVALHVFLRLKPLSSFVAPQAHVSLSHLVVKSMRKLIHLMTNLCPQVLNQTLQIDQELWIREEEGVLNGHVVDVLVQIV